MYDNSKIEQGSKELLRSKIQISVGLWVYYRKVPHPPYTSIIFLLSQVAPL